MALPSRVGPVSPAEQASGQRFEISTVTECPPTTVTRTDGQITMGAIRPVGIHIEHTRVGFLCLSVESLVHMAYNGGHYSHPNAARRDVVGGPSWIRTELRSLLEDRFQLRARHRVDDAPMYALKVARGGLTITPMAATECLDGCPKFRNSMNGTIRVWEAAPATMKTVANLFDLDRQVIDKTGVKDQFAIRLALRQVSAR